jgi:sugar/nucleoside kinase (ribokinase family)
MQQFDFVAVGDVTTDEFIELRKENAKVSSDPNSEREQICMNFGDELEYEGFVNVPAVGNSPNASVCAKRLGLKSALATNFGVDEGGDEIQKQLETEGVDMQFAIRHEGKISNHHYVLRYGAERTILIKHEEYPYKLPDIGEPKWLYFSSVGENSLPFHHEIANYIKSHPNVKLAFQPGSFQIKLGYETIKDMYSSSTLFFCNKEEAQSILARREKDIQILLQGMHKLGPKIVIITDGPKGAYSFDGNEMWQMPMYPDPAPPVDRTGAGDSFSATFTSALALGNSIPTALSWGPINSMSVVQHIGAQKGLLTLDALKKYLEDAPEDYKPKQLT